MRRETRRFEPKRAKDGQRGRRGRRSGIRDGRASGEAHHRREDVLVRLERDVAHLAGRSNEKRVEGASGCEGREANEEGRGARSRVGHFLKKKIGTSQVRIRLPAAE